MIQYGQTDQVAQNHRITQKESAIKYLLGTRLEVICIALSACVSLSFLQKQYFLYNLNFSKTLDDCSYFLLHFSSN